VPVQNCVASFAFEKRVDDRGAAEFAAVLHVFDVQKRLAKAQGEGDLSSATAPGHLIAILSQLLMDQLEHSGGRPAIAADGVWLSQAPSSRTKASVAAKMNGFLLTAERSLGAIPFGPGTIYAATNTGRFLTTFGITRDHIEKMFCKLKRANTNAAQMDEWYNAIKPIMLEISPVCDIAQGKRYNAHIVGGLAVPAANIERTKMSGESFTVLPPSSTPTLSLRWPLAGFNADEIKIVFHHGLKATMNAAAEPAWFLPWFRLRELPTTAVRNPHMSHGSRVGYVSLT
jgi:hypothetical protein